MFRPTTRKGSAAMRVFAQQSLMSSVEVELQAANLQVRELQELLEAEKAKTSRLEADIRRLKESWRTAFSQGGSFKPDDFSRAKVVAAGQFRR